jgi:predicted nucleic acid-binding protein
LAEIIILDTDIASAFAKVHKIITLKEFLSHYELAICPAIYEELVVSQEYGYSFPGQIFENIKILSPTNDEISDYHNLLNTKKNLGKGEQRSALHLPETPWDFFINGYSCIEICKNL